MVSIDMKFKGKILVDTPGALEIFRVEYLNAFKQSLETLRDMVRERTPIGVSSRLYLSITYRLKELTPKSAFGFPTAPPEFEGKVFSRSETEYFLGIFPTTYSWVCTYGPAVESGTRPHWPPLIELRDWASRVLFLARPEATLAAYFIGRKISKYGTRGRYMFRNARQAFMSQGIFEKNIEAAAEVAIKKATVETPWWAAF